MTSRKMTSGQRRLVLRPWLPCFLVAPMVGILSACSSHKTEVTSRVDQSPMICVEDLYSQADRCWGAGEYRRALLHLEHACALVATYDIVEEGGTDYKIKQRVLELSKMGRVDVLETALENSAYFPQTCGWIWGWAGELGREHEVIVSSNLYHLMEMEREVASLHGKVGDTLKRRVSLAP